MKKTMLLILGLALLLSAASAEETTTTTTTSTTTTTLISAEATLTATAAAATTAPPAVPVSVGTSIRSGAKNIILDNLNLIMDAVSNYKRDRFLLSRNYSTYIKLIRDNKGKENTSSKSIWADINGAENKTLPEYELQLDKLLKDLRNYVQDLN